MRSNLPNKLVGFFKSLCKIFKNIFISVAKGFVYIFKNIIMGIKYIFISIFVVLKYIFINIGLGIKYLFIGIYKLLYYVFKYLIFGFKYLGIYSYKILKYIFINIGLGIKYLFIGIYKLLYYVFKYLIFGFKYFGIYLYKILKYIFINIGLGTKYLFIGIYKLLYYMFKYLIFGFKNFGIYLYKILKYIFINIGLGTKYLFIGIYKLLYYFFVNIYKLIFVYFFKRVWLGIKYIFIGIYRFFKYLFKSFVVGLKTIGLVIKKLFKNSKKTFKKIGNFLFKAFILMPGNIIKKIYISYSDYSDKRKERQEEKNKRKQKYLIEKIAKSERIKKEKKEALLQRKEKALLIKKAREESKIKTKQERKSVSEKIKLWYAGLSFVKDIRNRREMKRQTLLIDFEGEDAVRSEEKIVYKFVAKNLATGKVEKSMFSAFSKLDVHSYLLSEGYEVYEITPIKKSTKAIFTIKIKKVDLVFFLTQLSTFLKSGITLVAAVKILEKQTKKPTYRQIYRSVIYELTMGENFSEALAKQGNSFPRLLVNMVKTSELTGNLPETLDDMASYYNETEKTRKQMVSAMTYPIVIFVFAIVIIVFILIFVIPEFVDIYADIDAELPAITSAVINISNFLQNNIYFILGALVVIAIVYRLLYVSIKVFKTLNQWIFMHMPVMGKIIIYNEVTMFTKTFGSLLNHNVFITDSMEVLSKVTNNEIYKMLIFDTITNLAKGEAISNSFKNHWAFPVIAYEMLLTGEKTGQLGDMMMKVSDYYQEQHKVSVNQIKVFIEPVMIVFLAVVVGTILLSVILPMFSMYSTVM
ncbi:MAG: type II secretion system F family protein [Bacilli bacterium]|nr:type II secretion system F family protein [Bacilli bacterium]